MLTLFCLFGIVGLQLLLIWSVYILAGLSDMLWLVVRCGEDFRESQRQAKAYRTPALESHGILTGRFGFQKTLTMAEFICRLGTPAGEVVTRTIEATGVHEAKARLEREGFRVFNVAPPKTSGVTALTRLGRGGTNPRVKPNDFLLFNQQLAALVRAGIPILQAISMLRKRAASARLRAVLGDVEDQIRGGAALSQAFAAQGSIFPRIYTASILAGERSGALDEVLSRYVTYMRRNVGLKRKIRGALAYPMFLLFASFSMVVFLTVYVVPRMKDLFAGFGNELPLPTLIVVGISGWLSGNILWFGPLVIGAAVVLFLWSRTVRGRQMIDAFLLKVPLIGNLIVQLSLAQATRS